MCGLGHSHGPAFGGHGAGQVLSQKQAGGQRFEGHLKTHTGEKAGGQWRGQDLRESPLRHTGHAMP